jgi:hypothetical protein
VGKERQQWAVGGAVGSGRLLAECTRACDVRACVRACAARAHTLMSRWKMPFRCMWSIDLSSWYM